MPIARAEMVAELFDVLNDRRRTPDEALVDVMTNADATNAERMGDGLTHQSAAASFLFTPLSGSRTPAMVSPDRGSPSISRFSIMCFAIRALIDPDGLGTPASLTPREHGSGVSHPGCAAQSPTTVGAASCGRRRVSSRAAAGSGTHERDQVRVGGAESLHFLTAVAG